MDPRQVTAKLPSGSDEVQIVFECKAHECGAYFIAYYKIVGATAQRSLQLMRTAPVTPRAPAVPEAVAKLSTRFVEIYAQSHAAEDLALDELSGMGYRKALEFLIKDFLIARPSADKDAIEKSLLGNCIKNYVDDSNIKDCAERAAWLGNDETHYVRKWVDRDVQDLKTLVQLTVSWINSVLLTEQLRTSMQAGNP